MSREFFPDLLTYGQDQPKHPSPVKLHKTRVSFWQAYAKFIGKHCSARISW
jgi:hypothetical protein